MTLDLVPIGSEPILASFDRHYSAEHHAEQTLQSKDDLGQIYFVSEFLLFKVVPYQSSPLLFITAQTS